MTSTLPRNRRTTVRARSTLTRIAFSLLGGAALASSTFAQQPTVRPWPGAYNAQISPWPGSKSTIPTSAAATAATPTAATPAPADSNNGSVGAASQPIRTLYYRKDSNTENVRPAPAADLSAPVSAGPFILTQGRTDASPMTPAGDELDPVAPGPYLDQALARVEQALKTERNPDNRKRLEERLKNIQEIKARFFTLDTEKAFIDYQNVKLRQDPAWQNLPEKDRTERLVRFPAHPKVETGVPRDRFFDVHPILIEPNFVCYQRLYFEDKNTERYGWEMGPLQPLLSSWQFFGNLQYLPYYWASYPCLRYDCSAGLCLPGDPVPMMLYPPGLSVTGALAQAGVTVAAYFIIP